MAIGTALAIGLGSAVLGAGASAISSSNNTKAINNATDAQSASNAQAIAAQERARKDNLALQTPIYNAGLPAINARNALLGLGGTQTAAAAQPAQQTAASQYGTTGFAGALSAYQAKYGGAGALGNFGTVGNQVASATIGQPATNAAQQQVSPQDAANNAFDVFRNSTGYNFRLNEGYDAVNSGYAGAGTLQSGAALRGITEYGQNFASNEFGNYFNMLGEQQNLSAGAANAMSGVNTTYANNAGSLAIANGENIANAAVARANNSNAFLGSLATGIGGVLGAL